MPRVHARTVESKFGCEPRLTGVSDRITWIFAMSCGSSMAIRSFAAAAAHPYIPGGKSGIRRAFVEFHHNELQKV
jgi:hypothetical protein